MSATVHPLAATSTNPPTVAEVVEFYFDRVELAATTDRKYRHTMGTLLREHGEAPIATLGPDDVTMLLEQIAAAAGGVTGQTWNRHRAALGSLWTYAQRRGWATDVVGQVERRKERRTRRGEQRQRTIPAATLEALWGNGGAGSLGHPLRERTFWRLMYDSAARCEEILGLNVEDLDVEDRSAAVVGKGGDVRRVRWQTGTQRMLCELVGDRVRGPLFLTERKASRDVAAADRCPETGCSRLSYTRAWELFQVATNGAWTLHQLRHTRLSQLGDDGAPLHLLQKISGHRSARSLEPYMHPSDDAVRALYDRGDPDVTVRPPG